MDGRRVWLQSSETRRQRKAYVERGQYQPLCIKTFPARGGRQVGPHIHSGSAQSLGLLAQSGVVAAANDRCVRALSYRCETLTVASGFTTDRTVAQEAGDWLLDYLTAQSGTVESASAKAAGRAVCAVADLLTKRHDTR